MGTVTTWLSASHASFSLGPLLSLSESCLPSACKQILILFLLHSDFNLLFHVFKLNCQKRSNNCRETVKSALTLRCVHSSQWIFLSVCFLREIMKTENKRRLVVFVFPADIDLLFDIGQKDSKTVLLYQCGRTYSKKRNSLCPLNWRYCVSTAVRCCDCVASSQQLYFYEHSWWKAHLCFFPGSGDLFPLAGSKNRYRTQTICSPERPAATHVQMCLCFSTLSLLYKVNPLILLHVLGYKMVHVIFVLFPSPLGCNCGDITDELPRLLPLRRLKGDLNKVQWESAV